MQAWDGYNFGLVRHCTVWRRPSTMRILLVKTSSLGDVVHNLPVASDLARCRPDAIIDWVVEESFVDIPRLHPSIRRVIPVAIRRWRKNLLCGAHWAEMAAFRKVLRECAYDVVLDTQGLLKSGLIVGQTQATADGRRCGYASGCAREPLAARFYDHPFDVPRNLHAVERNRRLAALALGYDLDHLPLDYGIAAAFPPRDTCTDSDYVVLLTATSRQEKLWPEVDWVTLGNALASRGLACVLPAGTAEERERAERLARLIPRGRVAPPQSIAELAALLAGSRLTIGVDTGLIHLAAGLGRPTIGLYCSTDPTLTGVLAADRAINLGSKQCPPSAAAVIDAAAQLLA
jgi:heptosyltransferase-1